MKTDALRQYAKLRQQLLDEKSQLESRLSEINEVLGSETVAVAPTRTAPAPRGGPGRGRGRSRRGRGGNALSMREAVYRALSKRPLARKELVEAVQQEGYVFSTQNPLNSIGSILYAKNSPVKNKAGKYFLPGAAQPAATAKRGNNGTAPKRRQMSPEAKARIAAAQRARWARQRAAKS